MLHLVGRRARGTVLVACLCLAWLMSAGCAPRPAGLDNVVTGVVTYGGEPVWEGRVTFLGPDNRVATTTLASDGSFRIAGPLLGTVRVGVVNYPTMPRGAVQPEAGPPRVGQALSVVPARPSLVLPERYAEPAGSGVTVEVQPGEQEVAIRLDRQKGDPPVVRRADLPSMGTNVGQVAPDIRGEGLEGKSLRLRDHRGKVVALLFWGHWCSLCRDQFAHERSLVERTKGQPFVLLGVNTDRDRDKARQESARAGLNWRSWWDGGVNGPVGSTWQMPGLPFVVLIDQHGVVRHRALGGAELDRAIDQLVAALPPASP